MFGIAHVMKPSKIISGILVTLSAVVPGYGVLAFLIWLYPKQIVPGSGAVPLRAVHFGSFTLDRSGMLIALIVCSIMVITLIGYGLSIIFSGSDDA
jgi:hypothetical protein